MNFPLLALMAAALPAAAPTLPSTPRLGTEAARCRPHETGPAILITVEGLKDRAGTLRAEVYPSIDGDFLADDNVLVSQGKTFRRAVIAVPPSGPAQLCLRVPAAGDYSLSVVHSRSADNHACRDELSQRAVLVRPAETVKPTGWTCPIATVRRGSERSIRRASSGVCGTASRHDRVSDGAPSRAARPSA